MLDPIFLAISLVASAVAVLAMLVRMRRDQAIREAIGDVGIEIPIDRIAHPTPLDRRAYEVVEEQRRRILWRFTTSTALGIQVIHELGFEVLRAVASVYHPESERPELQASIRGLLELNRRVSARLDKALGRFPLASLAGVKLETVLDTQARYRRVVEHPIAQRIVRHRGVARAAREAWAAYNATNPWYWGRRAAFGMGREVAVRRFLVLVATIVGEESVHLYRPRTPVVPESAASREPARRPGRPVR